MATYLELSNIKDDAGYGDWVKKITHAVKEKAHAISQEATPTAEKVTWAKEALTAPNEKRKQIENFILADNSDLAISVIIGASDAGIQTGVDKAVDDLLSI